MEFKDKLKKLRTERSLSQQALADAIFISRSAVAKWENGLGMPSQDSLQALANYFGISPNYFTTEEPEKIIVQKNQTIRHMLWGLELAAVAAVLAIIVAALILPALHRRPLFGFSSQSAAGVFADAPCIHTEDYDFYLGGTTMVIDDCDSGMQSLAVTHFQAVEQVAFLYRPVVVSCTRQAILEKSFPFMTLVSLQGETGWHNFLFRNYAGVISNLGIMVFDTVTANGREVPVQQNCYFFTDQPVEALILGNILVELGAPIESTE